MMNTTTTLPKNFLLYLFLSQFAGTAAAFMTRGPALAIPTVSSSSLLSPPLPSSSSSSNPSFSSSSSSTLWYKNEGDDEDDELDSLHGDDDGNGETDLVAMNVLGTALRPCCGKDGEYCSIRDLGQETVCCQVTKQFLKFSKSKGNDLTLDHEDGSPGLADGDIGCITVEQWADAYNNGMAPYLFLESTHEKTLEYVMLDFLQVFAIDLDDANRRLDELNADRARLDKLF